MMSSPSMASTPKTMLPMWRSNTSSALTLVITLALIRHFSKPPQESSQADNGRGGQSRSGSKPKVDMVSHVRLLDDTYTHTWCANVPPLYHYCCTRYRVSYCSYDTAGTLILMCVLVHQQQSTSQQCEYVYITGIYEYNTSIPWA